MRQVVRLEVVGIEARPLGAEGVIFRAKRVGGFRIGNDRADLLADHLGQDLVGSQVVTLITEDVEDGEQLTGLPRRLEAFPTHLLRGGHPADLCEFDGYPAARPPRGLAVAHPVGCERREALRRSRSVVGGDGEVRGALEHGEVRGLGCYQRDRLDP